jgi:hypothetical protein
MPNLKVGTSGNSAAEAVSRQSSRSWPGSPTAKGEIMNKAFRILGVFVLGLGAAAAAQGAEPTGSGPVTIEYYYKIVPGGMMPGGPSEWLSLYLKNHHPILQRLRKEGLILSEKLYERRFHAETPAWDYKVVMVWRDWAALQEAGAREPGIIHALYPDKAAHDREEKRRWELTERHWDDVLKQVPLD